MSKVWAWIVIGSILLFVAFVIITIYSLMRISGYWSRQEELQEWEKREEMVNRYNESVKIYNYK